MESKDMDNSTGASPISVGALLAEVEELKGTVSSLKKSLSQANKQIVTLEGEGEANKKLLAIYRRSFPQFERQMEELNQLLKVEETMKQLVKVMGMMAEEQSKIAAGKQDQVAHLTWRIGQMKKGKPVTWVNYGNGEDVAGIEAALILPEEVWEFILQKVTDPKDLWNSSNTCGLFKKILHDWKSPTWLFKHALPYLFRYLPRNLILKCRLVSKGWNMVVDQFVENHPSLLPQDEDKEKKGFDSRTMLPLGGPLLERRFDKLNRFDLREDSSPNFPSTPGRNPFIGRAVTLVIGMPKKEDEGDYWRRGHNYYRRDYDFEAQEERVKRFWERIFSFLKAFGEHIWYLTLDSYEGNLGDGDDYKKQMLQLLTTDLPSLLPNLRKLRLLQGGYEEYCGLGNIEASSFPLAPKLEAIVADDSNFYSQQDHNVLIAVIQRHHSQLRAIHLSGDLFGSKFLRRLEWPELRELYLDSMVESDDFEVLREAVMPNLKKLGVNMGGRYWSFDWLLDVLHKFFGSTQLSTLRICGGIGPKMFQQSRWKGCMSPTLTTLEVEHGKGVFGFYKFLHFFPLVENLHVFEKSVLPYKEGEYRPCAPGEELRVKDTQRELAEVDVSKYLFGGKIYQSNVWRVLPRLKLFTFKWDRYTKAEYEQIVQNRGK